MKNLVLFTLIVLVSNTVFSQEERRCPDLLKSPDVIRTTYQQAGGYNALYDLKTDGVMVYGISDGDIAGYSEWGKKSGSVVQVMTGIAWGEYQDYLDGRVDGVEHWDDAQVDAHGQQVLHNPTVPYINPSISFCDYLIARLKKVIDEGVETVYLEEPEFWAFSGYGDSFKREWRIYYGEEWTRPDSSCDALYRANQLKAFLYRRALDKVGSALKEYSLKKYNRPLSFYVATHSLVSYAQIRMVSPEATLMDLPGVDGLIAQIWTGTARVPNQYQGRVAERTFEMSLLEYGVMSEMVRDTPKQVYFLNDPVEDDPKYDWNDYQKNYWSTLTASLMSSTVARFEVAPWPSRVFTGTFPAGSPDATGIPSEYASLLLAGFHQLRDMEQPNVSWNGATEGIGVPLSDSAMFERGAPNLWRDSSPENPDRTTESMRERALMSGFFGLTLPLLKAGIPVEVPLLDHVIRFPGYLDPYKILVLSYEFQKPLAAGIHAELADWVRRGGVLIYVGAGRNPFHATTAWWNTGKINYATSDEHLLVSLGLDAKVPAGDYAIGQGWLILDRTDPAWYSRSSESADEYRALVQRGAEKAGLGPLTLRNYFLKDRGPYRLAACLEESVASDPLVLHGRYLDLTDAALPICKEVILPPGTRKWLLDLDRVQGEARIPLVCGGRITDWQSTGKELTFNVASPVGVSLIARFRLDRKPSQIFIAGQPLETWIWDEESHTLFWTTPVETADPVPVQFVF